MSSAAGGYSMLYNVLNYPGGSMPVTKVTQQDVADMAAYPNTTYNDKKVREVRLKFAAD